MSGLNPGLWRDLIGVPFRANGRGPDAYDCYGLLLEIYRRRGILVTNWQTPAADMEMERLVTRALGLEWRRVDTPIPGCALLFRDVGLARHIGVHLEGDRFIHCSARLGQAAVERLAATRSFLPLLGAYVPVGML
jgi:cell wall-associated NlpC family hydrolase